MDINYEDLPKKSFIPDVKEIVIFAKENGYSIFNIDYKTGLIQFRSGAVKINLYSTSFTMTTQMDHPKQGKTQLHRKGLTLLQIKEVFINPRIHTGMGYQKKKKNADD